jgi:hypothetical protein
MTLRILHWSIVPPPTRGFQPEAISDAHSTPRHVLQDHRPVERGPVAGNVQSRPVDLSATFPELQGVNPWVTAVPEGDGYSSSRADQPRSSATFVPGLDSNSSTQYDGPISPDSSDDAIRGEVRATYRPITPEEHRSMRQQRVDRERQRRGEWERPQAHPFPFAGPSGSEDLHAIWGQAAPRGQDIAPVHQKHTCRERSSERSPLSESVDFGFSDLTINEPGPWYDDGQHQERSASPTPSISGSLYNENDSPWERRHSRPRDESSERPASMERYLPTERHVSSGREHSTVENDLTQQQPGRYPVERHPRHYGMMRSSPTESYSFIEQHSQDHSPEPTEEASRYRPPGSFPLSERYAPEGQHDRTRRDVSGEPHCPTRPARATERDHAPNSRARPTR